MGGQAMAEPPAEPGTWLTYSEAAKATGELPDKLRRMVRDGKLTARTPQESNDRKWRLLIPPHMLREGQAVGQGEGQVEAEPQAEALAMLRDELAEARERAAKAEGLAEARAEASTALAAALAKAEALADQLRPSTGSPSRSCEPSWPRRGDRGWRRCSRG